MRLQLLKSIPNYIFSRWMLGNFTSTAIRYCSQYHQWNLHMDQTHTSGAVSFDHCNLTTDWNFFFSEGSISELVCYHD